ncbi:SDR family NAD(P)-dependent oxidoreductase [Ferrovibrio sp.]|uniref:SDR family NAD(P)-dependent oxidoreductase n=1 Tax=Ferrovibrio sp. TaxID=1917215 RepID=UPI002634F31B|nr:SDR family oxidoreductase [Ferrovibrio sp.]
MDLVLAGKTIIVGGSSRGIGKAISAAFLDENARVVLTGRNETDLEAAREELGRGRADRVMAIAGDLTDRTACNRLMTEAIGQWGRIDCVVANAGSGRGTAGWAIPADEWTEMLQRNLWPGIGLVEAALPRMIEAGDGNVVMIGSIAGQESIGAPIAYAVAKSAIASYCKNLARAVGPHGIRVNCVAPGNVLFSGGTWDRKLKENPIAVQEYIEREVPLNRFASPEEIADIVVFLASARASFITGSCIVADGGQTRGGH